MSNNNNNEHNELITKLNRLIDKLDDVEKRIDGVIEKINNTSSNKIPVDTVTIMTERWDTTGPR